MVNELAVPLVRVKVLGASVKRALGVGTFMEMVVEEMEKSRSEHADKHDPLVGAVIVDSDGKFLGATHRGELRVGDHAEFTLIERSRPTCSF